MASLTCKRSNNRGRLAVVVIRESGQTSIPGYINWLSNEEFKMVIDSPLKFQEKLKLVFNFGTVNEIRIPANVGIIKRETEKHLSVHGTFASSLDDEVVQEFSEHCQIDQRDSERHDCNLSVTMQVADSEDQCDVLITNISAIGCCFVSSERLRVDDMLSLHFHDLEDHIMTVPAIVCRVEKHEQGYRYGSSFRSTLNLLAEESSVQTSVNWPDKIAELIVSLPSM